MNLVRSDGQWRSDAHAIVAEQEPIRDDAQLNRPVNDGFEHVKGLKF